MNKIVGLFTLLLLMFSCKPMQNKNKEKQFAEEVNSDFTIAFGSCNKTKKNNVLWDDVLAVKPDLWAWGGDIIYADTENMDTLHKMYAAQKNLPSYAEIVDSIPIIGTWDDHDYGLNDGGKEFSAKKGSQQEFLDFMDVPKDSPRRKQEGVYTLHSYNTPKGKVNVIVLDTRYFRTALTEDLEISKRNKPNVYGEGTILGKEQWLWFKDVLTKSDADFNVILSSVQVLSNKHGFECWGNFPHEVDKLKNVIVSSKAKGVILLSGDRHISEFSKTEVKGLDYPLLDFTSSGLTHAYKDFSGEENPFRVGEVVFTESFGVLKFDFEKKKVVFQIVGNNAEVLEKTEQWY